MFRVVRFGLSRAALGFGIFLINAGDLAFYARLTLVRDLIVLLVTAGPGTAIVRAAPVIAAIFAIFIIVAIIAGLATLIIALGPGLVLTRLVVGNHTEIVIRELQVILSLHPVAIMLRILRKLFVFIEQLWGVAPRAAVNPVLVVATT